MNPTCHFICFSLTADLWLLQFQQNCFESKLKLLTLNSCSVIVAVISETLYLLFYDIQRTKQSIDFKSCVWCSFYRLLHKAAPQFVEVVMKNDWGNRATRKPTVSRSNLCVKVLLIYIWNNLRHYYNGLKFCMSKNCMHKLVLRLN